MHLSDPFTPATGSRSGIGLGLSRQLAAMGSTVYICGRRAAKLEATTEAHKLHPIISDVTFVWGQRRSLDEISSEHGHLNLLINKDGIFLAYDFASETDAVDRIETEVSVNAIASLALAKQALLWILRRKGPSILLFGSGVAYVPVSRTPVYWGTKPITDHSKEALRLQLALMVIEVYRALPTVVDTGMGKVRTLKNLKIMPPQDVVSQILEGMQRDQQEILLGHSKQLYLMSRLAPEFVFRKMVKTDFQ